MFASLPMYDLPELRAETDALWSAVAAGLRARGVEAPDQLSRGGDLHEGWRRPDLLLSQACGLPYVRHLRGEVALVGAGDYDLPDCAPGTYRSRILVRAEDPARGPEDLRGRTLAVNSEGSQSGAGALRTLLRAQLAAGPFFGGIRETGAHLESIRALARGEVDVAAIDAVTFALARRVLPEAGAVRVLLSTPETPGLPFVTRPGGPVEALFAALAEGIDAVGRGVRGALLLRGVVPRRDADFDGIAADDALNPPLDGR